MTFVNTAISNCVAADVAHLPKWAQLPVGLAHDNGSWILLVTPIVIVLASIAQKRLGNPRAWEAVHGLLDNYRDEIFGSSSDTISSERRITLFKQQKYRLLHWPSRHQWLLWGQGTHLWSGWLVPVARSGHRTQKSKTCFLAGDNENQWEGVAGRGYAGALVVVTVTHDLPNFYSLVQQKEREKRELETQLRTRGLDATTRTRIEQRMNTNSRSLGQAKRSLDDAVQAYSTSTHVPASWVYYRLKHNISCPKALCATLIESDGSPWGALVVDSVEPNFGASTEAEVKEKLKALSKQLNYFLKTL